MLDHVQSDEAVLRVTGVLKWFSNEKGYGFIQLPNRPDAMLHVSLLREQGYINPLPGAIITCDISRRNARFAVVKLISITAGIDPSEAVDMKVPMAECPGAVSAIVKFYKNKDGYGMLEQTDGGPDIFVHCSTLRACGVQGISEGQRVTVVASEGHKGLRAQRISLAV